MAAAFVPGFDYDVFLSYPWVDNKIAPGTQQQAGWIATLREGLRQAIDGELGRENAAKLFIDTAELNKSQSWGKQLEEALDRTAVFVMVLSPGYIHSPACRSEIAHFKKVVESCGNQKIWQSGRLFVVHMRPLPDDADDWPEGVSPQHMQDYFGPKSEDNPLGYRFYVNESGRSTPKQLKPTDQLYQDTLDEMRAAVAARLKAMKKAAKAAVRPPKPTIIGTATKIQFAGTKPTILLAKPTDELRKMCLPLVKWCESAGLRVLPENPWPANPPDFQRAYLEALKQSHLVVQFLGDLPADTDSSFPQGREQWQFDTSKAAGINVFRLREPGIELSTVEPESYRKFVSEADVRPDVLELCFQEVGDRVRRAFDVGKGPPRDHESHRAMVKFCRDSDSVQRMLDRLAENNVECRASKNGRPLLDRWREIPFDGLMVVLGDCDDAWLEDRGDELQAVELGLKDQSPVRAYFHPEGSRKTPPLTRNDILQIHGEAELEKFVTAMQTRGGAR